MVIVEKSFPRGGTAGPKETAGPKPTEQVRSRNCHIMRKNISLIYTS